MLESGPVKGLVRAAGRGRRGGAAERRPVRDLLCPTLPRRIPGHRALGIALRTVHIATFGTLLGGHVFAADPDRLWPFLAATALSGLALVALELASTCEWLLEGRGLAVAAKLAVLAAVPLFWEQRVALLLAVVVIASVTSHMPARFRHRSFRPDLEAAARRTCASGGRPVRP
jgi:hypothetical protein